MYPDNAYSYGRDHLLADAIGTIAGLNLYTDNTPEEDEVDDTTDDSTDDDSDSGSSECRIETPYSLSTTALTSSSATVSWSDDSQSISHYNVRYSLADASDWTKIKVDASENSTVFSDLTAGANYDWQVPAICADNTGTNYSDAEAYFTTNDSDACSLVTPYNLTESNITSSSATLSWSDDSENISHYNVRYSLADESDVLRFERIKFKVHRVPSQERGNQGSTKND